MRQYYYPPSGFGFWYQLGVFNIVHKDEDIVLGSSSGSLICLISILKKEHRQFKIISDISLDLIKEINQYNLHFYVTRFIEAIFLIINQYDSEYIKERLSKVYIIITDVQFLSLNQVIVNPKDLQVLKEAITASCYIPMLSRFNNLLYYPFNNMKCIDGVFSSKFTSKKGFKTINSIVYASVIPCSYNKAKKMYDKGLSGVDEYENLWCITIIFNVIYNNIYDILYTLKCICYTIFNKNKPNEKIY